jgi:hypothetical protein
MATFGCSKNCKGSEGSEGKGLVRSGDTEMKGRRRERK